MPERLSKLEKWQIGLSVEAKLAVGQIDAALDMVSEEAKKITKLGQFHLGGGQWINGINLGNLRLSAGRTRPAMMITTVVFDFTNGAFRFCDSLKQVTRSVEGISVIGSELEGQTPEGHRIFFEGGTRDQQHMLLSSALEGILSIRKAEARMPKV